MATLAVGEHCGLLSPSFVHHAATLGVLGPVRRITRCDAICAFSDDNIGAACQRHLLVHGGTAVQRWNLLEGSTLGIGGWCSVAPPAVSTGRPFGMRGTGIGTSSVPAMVTTVFRRRACWLRASTFKGRRAAVGGAHTSARDLHVNFLMLVPTSLLRSLGRWSGPQQRGRCAAYAALV